MRTSSSIVALVAGSALRTQNTNNYDFGIVAFALDRIFQNGFDR